MPVRTHWPRVPSLFAALVAALVAALAFGWSAAPHGQSSAAASPPALRLYVLDCGTLKDRDRVPYGILLEQMPPRDLADTCALLVHPRGTLLWETGVRESVNQSAPPNESFRPGGRRLGDRLARTLKSQLDALGYGPDDITYLALSHTHWDHTGNARDYLRSTWLAQKLERDAMFGGSTRAPNAADFAGLENAPTRVIDGDDDVFGDGVVRLILTPGHTPGHQVLFVRLPKTGPVILSGDLYHFPEELTLKPAETGRNAELTAASRAKIQQLMASTGARLWIQHDMQQYLQLKKAPDHYD
jgi:glyoxylase-like metal-dependent hydrolase (beta-lactamase superfamily II)